MSWGRDTGGREADVLCVVTVALSDPACCRLLNRSLSRAGCAGVLLVSLRLSRATGEDERAVSPRLSLACRSCLSCLSRFLSLCRLLYAWAILSLISSSCDT